MEQYFEKFLRTGLYIKQLLASKPLPSIESWELAKGCVAFIDERKILILLVVTTKSIQTLITIINLIISSSDVGMCVCVPVINIVLKCGQLLSQQQNFVRKTSMRWHRETLHSLRFAGRGYGRRSPAASHIG